MQVENTIQGMKQLMVGLMILFGFIYFFDELMY